MIIKSKFLVLIGTSRCDVRARSSRRSNAKTDIAGAIALLITTCATQPLLAQTSPQDFPSAVQFELGDSGFLPGDSITIQEVRGTSDAIQPGGTYSVTGTYTLTSHDNADLCLFATTTNRAPTPTDPAQCVHLTNGTGTFRLIKKMNEDGYLHVTFYSGGHGVGGVYFGQGQWLLRNAHYDFTGASSQRAHPATSAPVSAQGPNQALMEYLGNPVPPPPNMNPAYTKEGLTQAVQAAGQAAGISLVKLEIDDSEFPFLVGVDFAKEGDKEKLKEQIRTNATYSLSGSVGGETCYVMNIVPYSAYLQGTGQRIYRRMMVREGILYEKLTGAY
jgi:hypothetical protein